MDDTKEPWLGIVGKLGKQSDNDSIGLTEEYLQIQSGSRQQAWSWQHVQRLSLQSRKLWLPLLGGGILACLCIVALFTTYKYPWWLLTGATAGALAAYYGWQPRPTLVVQESKHHTDFLLAKPNSGLPIYLGLANRLAIRYPQPIGNLWLPLTAEHYVALEQGGEINLQQPTRIFWPEDGRPTGFGLQIHPFTKQVKLSYAVNESGRLIAYVEGDVSAGSQVLLSAL